jgi:hypothetical protein
LANEEVVAFASGASSVGRKNRTTGSIKEGRKRELRMEWVYQGI